MDISERIERIKPYFVSFNVMAEESAAYSVVRLPKSWKIPDKDALKANFKVEIAPIQEGICFVTEIGNGSECIFNAIDYVIDFNKKVEERKGLFNEMIKELGDIFARESLDKLKTLRFVFEPQKKSSKKAKVKETVVQAFTGEGETEGEVNQSEPVTETPPVQEEKKPEENNDNSLMAFAKTITES